MKYNEAPPPPLTAGERMSKRNDYGAQITVGAKQAGVRLLDQRLWIDEVYQSFRGREGRAGLQARRPNGV